VVDPSASGKRPTPVQNVNLQTFLCQHPILCAPKHISTLKLSKKEEEEMNTFVCHVISVLNRIKKAQFNSKSHLLVTSQIHSTLLSSTIIPQSASTRLNPCTDLKMVILLYKFGETTSDLSTKLPFAHSVPRQFPHIY